MKIYDNGTHMLGNVKDIREYNDRLFREERINEDQWVEWAKELIWYKDTSIISIDYENGMGMLIEVWEENDVLKED